MQTSTAIAVLLTTTTLAACGYGGRFYDLSRLQATINANYLAPAVIYEEIDEPGAAELLAQGRELLQEGRYDDAMGRLLQAEVRIQAFDGPHSLYLLPVYDRMIIAELGRDNLSSADRLQHRYLQVINANFAAGTLPSIRAGFRMGCWHGKTSDWDQALFDFEAVINSLEETGVDTEKEKEMLRQSEELADLAAEQCIGNI